MNVSLFFLLAAICLFVCALLVVAGVIPARDVSNAAFVDAGLACLAVSFLPFKR